MYSTTERFGHYRVVYFDPADLVLSISSGSYMDDFDEMADKLRQQGFLPTNLSNTFVTETGEISVTVWERERCSQLPMDDLTRELSEQVARRAEALVYIPNEKVSEDA
jgi:hypothetical protein